MTKGVVVRLGALEERAVLLHGDQAADIALASAGRFGPDPMQLYAQWDEFREWERTADVSSARRPLRERDLACPVPEPGQILAVGLNHAEHAAETRYEVPAFPPVFTKFRSALAGPYGELRLPSGNVDWGVGMAREPQRWLQPGDVLRSHIEGIGEMEQRCVAG